MQDRIDPSNWPTSRGPWPEVTDSTRLLDPGATWCVNSGGHPLGGDGYPDPNIHYPFDECMTPSLFVEDSCVELAGPQLDLMVYAARPFLFGRPCGVPGAGRGRVAFDLCELGSGARRTRFSVGQGEALLLGAHLSKLVAHLNRLAQSTD